MSIAISVNIRHTGPLLNSAKIEPLSPPVTTTAVHRREIIVPNRKGLHARASAKFVKCAESFAAEIRVSREGHTVLGTSIMGLMMLGAGRGSTLILEAEGADAAEAMAALVALIEDRFGEPE
jgi:phosphocarrier protein